MLRKAMTPRMKTRTCPPMSMVIPGGRQVYSGLTDLIHKLIDILSKNGNLPLNVPPRSDGSLDDEIIRTLKGMGEWLHVNGEAIYEAKP